MKAQSKTIDRAVMLAAFNYFCENPKKLPEDANRLKYANVDFVDDHEFEVVVERHVLNVCNGPKVLGSLQINLDRPEEAVFIPKSETI